MLLIEVTSARSSAIDHGPKLLEYLDLPTLQHYLIISQTEWLAELYSRQSSGWQFEFFSSLSDAINLKGIGISLNVKDLYEGISFEDAE